MSISSSNGTAIITGCATGIGRSIAARFAAHGYDVVLNGVPSQQEALQELAMEIRSTGTTSRTLIVTADVSLESEVERLVRAAVHEFGGLDVV